MNTGVDFNGIPLLRSPIILLPITKIGRTEICLGYQDFMYIGGLFLVRSHQLW